MLISGDKWLGEDVLILRRSVRHMGRLVLMKSFKPECDRQEQQQSFHKCDPRVCRPDARCVADNCLDPPRREYSSVIVLRTLI